MCSEVTRIGWGSSDITLTTAWVGSWYAEGNATGSSSCRRDPGRARTVAGPWFIYTELCLRYLFVIAVVAGLIRYDAVVSSLVLLWSLATKKD